MKQVFELIFDELGRVEMLDAAGKSVWQSDSDENFAEEFEGDFFGDEDAEEIIDYLIDAGIVDENQSIDVVEKYLEDESPLNE